MNNRYNNIQMLKYNMERLGSYQAWLAEIKPLAESARHQRIWVDWMENEYPNMSEETKVKFLSH